MASSMPMMSRASSSTSSRLARRPRFDERKLRASLAVLDGLERFERRSTLKTWIFRILVNRAESQIGVLEKLNDELSQVAVSIAENEAKLKFIGEVPPPGQDDRKWKLFCNE